VLEGALIGAYCHLEMLTDRTRDERCQESIQINVAHKAIDALATNPTAVLIRDQWP
jgi:hypothetical protein